MIPVGFAQPGYAITYKRIDVNSFPVGDRENVAEYGLRYQLIANDSFSFFYANERIASRRGKKTYRPDVMKQLHHSVFNKRTSGELFYGVAFPDRSNPYLVREEFVPKPVYIDSATRMFKQWRCRDAFAVINVGDTVFARLAIDYPLPFAPMNYNYFPCLPLEIYRPKFSLHLVALRLETGNYDLVFPSALPVVGKGEKPGKPAGRQKNAR